MGDLLPELLAEMERRVAEQQQVERRLREEFGIFINFVPPTPWQGGVARALGTRLYPNRPAAETFHEFIVHVLRQTLGREWWVAQQERPPDERHFLALCFEAYDVWLVENAVPANAEGDLFAAVPNGWVKYLTSLAWDVASLIQASALPDSLVARLRDDQEFQGARYETAVAAIFARLNCEIRWMEVDPNAPGPIVEFVGTHRPTGTAVAVEAKSRRRTGVLNQPGEPVENPYERDRRSVRRLFIDSLAKRPVDPLLVFIDINAPVELTPGELNEWQIEVLRWMERLRATPLAAPGAFACLYVTNFSPHYDGDEIARGHEVMILPSPDAEPLPQAFAEALHLALNAYANIPEFRPGWQLAE